MHHLTIHDPDHGPLELAVRLDRPRTERARDLCIFYTHGFGSSQDGEKARYFRQRAMDDGVAFCSFDFRGHGLSGGELFDLSLTRNLEDCARVHAWLREQGFFRFVQFGSSMGGGTALWYAARAPEEMAAAIHIAPAIEMDKGLLDAVGKEAAARWRTTGRHAFETELITSDLSWGLIEDLQSYDRAELQRIYRTPTLIFQGTNDTSVSWRSVVEWATGCAFEGIEVRLMCDADHRLVDRLDFLWRHVLLFLESRQILPRVAHV